MISNEREMWATIADVIADLQTVRRITVDWHDQKIAIFYRELSAKEVGMAGVTEVLGPDKQMDIVKAATYQAGYVLKMLMAANGHKYEQNGKWLEWAIDAGVWEGLPDQLRTIIMGRVLTATEKTTQSFLTVPQPAP